MRPPACTLPVLLLALLLVAVHASGDGGRCSAVLQAYQQQHTQREAAPFTGSDQQLVFFLHVPRTAGRTFHSCFLVLGTQPERRCPKAYDHLRMDVTAPNCSLLSTHDDFSLVSQLPEGVAVLTHLRDPVDRLLSAYEFAVEVGGRQAGRAAAPPPAPPEAPSANPTTVHVSTDNVWPWTYLVPFFAQDIQRRREALAARSADVPEEGNWILVKHPDGYEYYYNKVKNISKWTLTPEEQKLLLPPLDPYDNELFMPLREFVEHPIARELLHNNQMLQVLGVTNYSRWQDAASVRECFWQDEATRAELAQVAHRRMARFMHVGVTDKLAESVTAVSAALNRSLLGPAWGQLPADKSNNNSSNSKSGARNPLLKGSGAVPQRMDQLQAELRDLEAQVREAQGLSAEGLDEFPQAGGARKLLQGAAGASRMLAFPLGVEYQRCAQRAQARNGGRRANSLAQVAMPDGRFVTFSKEARAAIPQAVMDSIRRHNAMDVDLHARATQLLLQRRAELATAGALQNLPEVPAVNGTAYQPPRFRIPVPQGSQPKRDELRR